MEKKKKAILILKQYSEEYQTLESYEAILSLSHQTLDLMMKDLDCKELVPQLDLTMELELLK